MVKFASDAGSIVDCMQPPSRIATPNSATDKPLAAISSSLPIAARGDRVQPFQSAIKRKTQAIATISRLSTKASGDLLHECRTRVWTTWAARATRPVKPKNDFADKTLREGLP
jgi:hypothetical protein